MGPRPGRLASVGLAVLACSLPAFGQQRFPGLTLGTNPFAAAAQSSTSTQQSIQQLPGIVSGVVLDQTGAAVAGARVTLTHGQPSSDQAAVTDENGAFSIPNVTPGPFHLTITANGFASHSASGTLQPGEMYNVPQITLAVAGNVTEVKVTLPTVEIAEEQVKVQEQQRILGFIPNFYVSYVPDAAPLNPKQKFRLAWRSLFDPANFIVTAGIAGIQQWDDQYNGYGQGAEGYGKRYGASLANQITGTFIGSAILPSVFKQDPRFFYKGTGTVRSRVLYAIANAVICKGDNGHWEPNYSTVLGDLAAGGISNLYYPPGDRSGIGLTFENTLFGLAGDAASNILQEFVVPKLSHFRKPKFSTSNPSNP
jgi:hypothetical protein